MNKSINRLIKECVVEVITEDKKSKSEVALKKIIKESIFNILKENLSKNIISLPTKEIDVFGRKTTVIDLSPIGGTYVAAGLRGNVMTIKTKLGKFKVHLQSQTAEKL